MAEGTPVPGPISNPFLQETLNRDHAPPPFRMPHLKRHSCPLPSGPASSCPGGLPRARGARVPPFAPRN